MNKNHNLNNFYRSISFFILAIITLSFCFSLTSCNSKKEDEMSSDIEISSQNITSSEINLDSSMPQIPVDTQNNSQIINETPSYSIDNISQIENLSNKKNGWGPGTGKNFSRPLGATDAQSKFGKYDSYYIAPDSKKVYITFDEGYENGYTPAILDTLKEKNVSGLFFVTYDFAKNNAELIKRMIDEGHIVGNHSHKHPSFPDISTQKMIDEIQFLHNYIKENFGYEMKYFRFPMGEFSEKSLAVCKALGYKSIFWSFAYLDWNVNSQPDPTTAFNTISKNAHNGCIYLLHAVSKTNTSILGRVIDDIREKGYDISKFDL
ncbi:MAG: polysaccharide deacetylase family protein [Oscillospiraceae bacterium]